MLLRLLTAAFGTKLPFAAAQNYVRFLGYSGREMLAVRLSHFGPTTDLGRRSGRRTGWTSSDPGLARFDRLYGHHDSESPSKKPIAAFLGPAFRRESHSRRKARQANWLCSLAESHRQGRHTPPVLTAPLAADNKCLAQSNKSCTGSPATNKQSDRADTYEASRDRAIGSWLAPRCARVSSRRSILNDHSTEAVV
jgi:hypothetical protein